jgi:phosphatidylglycerophosphatase A
VKWCNYGNTSIVLPQGSFVLQSPKAVFHYNVATLFGLGNSPVAPGTLGSLVGVALVYFFFPSTHFFQALFILAITLLGFLSSTWMADANSGSEDPQEVIIDEVAGQAVVFFLIPQPLTLVTLLVGFVAFRIFDVWKPWLVGRAEKLPRGWGIMADDLVAGIFAFLVLHLWIWLFP